LISPLKKKITMTVLHEMYPIIGCTMDTYMDVFRWDSNLYCPFTTHLSHSLDRPSTYHLGVMPLGTVVPGPADAGLNPVDEG
jgi:hypothetical protein